MNARRLAIVSALALGILPATTLRAQKGATQEKPAADNCKIDFNSNSDVKNAHNTVTVVQIGASKGDDAKKKLHSAVAGLTSKADFGKDQAARDYVLGEALVFWSEQPGEPAVAPRGDLGYASNPTGTVDILAAADTAFTAVEKANPECTEDVSVFRQQPWARLINQVGPLITANNLDSANAILTRSLTIYRGSPYSYYFQGQIAQKKKDWAAAAQAYGKAVALATPELAAKDTNIANVREYCEFSSAYSTLQVAQAASGDEQKAGMKKAADLYRTYLKDYPNGEDAKPAQAGLTVAIQGSGDTTALASIWQGMLSNPSQYSSDQLFNAGTQAFAANQMATAVKLFELGHKGNPLLRTGLFNLANAYWKSGDFEKMLPIVDTLIKVDPDNGDNLQLIAIAYQGMQKSAATPKAKRTLNDSVAKYVEAADKLPIKLTVGTFDHDSASAKLTGTIQNLLTTPKTGTLSVHFVDRAGNTVATESVPVDLKANESKPFTVEGKGAGIVAFTYDPLK